MIFNTPAELEAFLTKHNTKDIRVALDRERQLKSTPPKKEAEQCTQVKSTASRKKSKSK